jgi:starch phosphorylase
MRTLFDGTFSHHEPERYQGLVHQLTHHDPYFLTADFDSYLQAQRAADTVYADPAAWAERVLRNIAGMGRFSVDRTIGEYMSQVWNGRIAD